MPMRLLLALLLIAGAAFADDEGYISALGPTLWLDASTAPTEEGPIRHFRLNETGASTAIGDLTANGNGTAARNAQDFDLASGSCKVSTCLDFSNGGATTDDIDLGANVIADNGAFTFCAWIYVDTAGMAGGSLGRIFTAEDDVPSFFTVNGGTFSISGSSVAEWTWTATTWTHICISRPASSGVFSFYKNGEFVSTSSSATGTEASIRYIGNRSAADRAFDGRMDNIKIWDYAISSAQVAAEYHGGSPRESEGTVYSGSNLLFDDGGSLVYSWQSKNNTVSFRQVTDANKPTRAIPTGLFRWSVAFAGTNDRLGSSWSVGDLVDATDYTIFIIYKATDTAGDQPLLSSSTGNDLTIQVNSDEDLQVIQTDAAGAKTITATGQGDTSLSLATILYDHTALGLSVNGATPVWGYAGAINTLTDAFTLGMDGTDFLTGNISEVLVFDKALAPKQIERISAHLAKKHGVTMAGASDFDRCSNFFLSKTPTMHLDSSVGSEVGPLRFFTLDDSAASTAIVDKVGNANGVASANSDTFDLAAGSCKAGTCLDFNGSSHNIDLGSDVIGTGADSFCAWINPDSLANGVYGRIANNGKFDFIIDGDNDRLWYSNNASTSSFSNSSVLAASTWQHVCITRDASTAVKFYVNAVDVTSDGDAGTSAGGTGNLFIGSRSAGDYWFDGKIDEVRIYNYQLTQQQVTALYNGGTAHQYFSTVGPSLTQAAPVVLDDGGSLVLAWQGKFNATPVEFSQTTDANKPTWTSGGIDFDGSAAPNHDILTSPSTLDTIFNADAKTQLAVLKFTATAGANSRYLSAYTDPTTYFALYESNDNSFVAYNVDADGADSSSVSATIANINIVEYTHNGAANQSILVNGGTPDADASGNTTTMTSVLTIGARADGSFPVDGLIMEILADDSVWTAAELSQARRCLGNKYGVSY